MTSRWFDDLGEDPAGRAGVKEGDAAVADADPRLAVDQLDAGGGEARQGGVDVVDRVGDVVQAGAGAGEEFADRGVGAERARAARRGPRRRPAAPPRRPANRPSRGGRAPSRSSSRRGRSRRRDPRRRLRCGRCVRTRRASLWGRLGAEDLGHRREADLELVGARLLGRPVALDLPARRVEGLGQRLAVVPVGPGEGLDRERGARKADERRGPRSRACRPGAPARSCRAAEISIIGTTRLEPQRSCSFGTAAASWTPCS